MTKTIVKTTVFDPVTKTTRSIRLSVTLKLPEIAALLAVRALNNRSKRARRRRTARERKGGRQA